tara:strand:+ start:177 stop:536 length:360 start_codon:yes stop_codon:yes gene_type:complete
MRKIAILLTLTMLLGSLVGCLGEDDDAPSLVGDWYEGEEMIIDIKEDGSAVISDGSTGTWSADGDTLTLTIDDHIEEYTFVIKGDWLWLKDLGDNDSCIPLAPDAYMQEDEQTPPAMCE